MIKLHIGEGLTRYTENQSDFTLPGETFNEVVTALIALHPEVESRIRDEQGGIRRHLALFRNGELIKSPSTPVQPGDELEIVAALAGG